MDLSLLWILVKRDFRDGRWLSTLYFSAITILSLIANSTYILALLVLAPRNFLNLIWLDSRDSSLMLIYGNNRISSVVFIRKFITVIELNIPYLLLPYIFQFVSTSSTLEHFLHFNIYILFFFIISDYTFPIFLESRLINLTYFFRCIILTLAAISWTFVISIETFNKLIFAILMLLLLLNILNHFVLYPNLNLDQYLIND